MIGRLRLRAGCVLAAIALLGLPGAGARGGASQRDIRLYVAPAGSDTNPGTKERPFATLEAARRAAAKELSSARGSLLAIHIRLRGGVYRLAGTFVLTGNDAPPRGCSVTYEAGEGEHPVLSGGTRLGPWEEAALNGHSVWKTPLPDNCPALRELWVNGSRMPQSRYPRTGYLSLFSVPGVSDTTDWLQGESAFCARRMDMPPGETFRGAEAVVMNRWVESRLPVTAFDADSALFTFGRKSVFRLDRGDPYYLVNVRSAFGAPGDWFVDEEGGALYYYPRPGEHPGSLDAVVPRLTTLVRIECPPDSGPAMERLRFRGITFAHAGWYFPRNGATAETGGFPQAATGVPAAFVARGMQRSAIERCTFAHMGTYAVELGAGCRADTIGDTEIFDLGGGGIRIGETVIRDDARLRTEGNTVVDCRIHDGGRLFHSAIGVWIGQSGHNNLVHNQIHDFYYTGISIGWTWGYGPALGAGNLVALNHVHHIGVLSSGDGPVLSDMGGIYTLGNQDGTTIRNNIFHDIAGLRYGGWGIYFDEGTTHCTAEGNLVYRTTHGGFHQHYGRENRFAWNILAWGRDFQIQRTRYERHTGFAFEHNIVIWNAGRLLTGSRPWGNLVFDHNTYWNAAGDEVRFDSLTPDAWRAMGYDRHSRIADPGFRDPVHGDFRFRRGAGAGFPSIPFAAIRSETPAGPGIPGVPARRRRLLFNSDGSNIFWRRTFAADSVYADIDRAADGGVTTFLFNPNPSQRIVYPGSAGEMFSYDAPGAGPLTLRDTMYGCFSGNLRMLLRDSLDPVGMIVDRVRLRGMEAFLSVRMNDLHDVDVPASPLLSAFWKAHPEYRLGRYEGWGASALNYALAPVREHFAGLVRELCARYAVDGIELDFMRFPYYLPRDSAGAPPYAGVMTSFVRSVRAIVDSAARARGRKILLAVRVPSTPSGCAYTGLDPARWSREHSVDMVTVAPFLSTEEGMPVREFRAACPGVPLYACFEFTCGERMMTPEEIRGAAAVFYGEGADGIYAFNFFCAREGGEEPAYGVFNDIGDPAALDPLAKVYTLSAAKYPVPRVSPQAPLPLVLAGGGARASATIRTCEHGDPRSVRLRVECDRDVTPADLAVTFNGVRLRGGEHPARGRIAPGRVLYAEPQVSRSLEFSPEPRLLRRSNVVTVAAAVPLRVEWLYLGTAR